MTKPAGLLLVLLASASASACACAADTRSPDPRDPGDPPSQKMHGIILTASTPQQDLAILALPAAPGTLTLTIATIDNPSSQAFSVGASVSWSNAGTGAIEETIGSVTPFPATQPGSFALGVSEAARRLLSRSNGQLSLRLSLQPIASDRPLAEPLRVILDDPAWR